MKLLALEIETPGLEDEDFRPHMKAEARRAWELHQSGVIRELYFRQDNFLSPLQSCLSRQSCDEDS